MPVAYSNAPAIRCRVLRDDRGVEHEPLPAYDVVSLQHPSGFAGHYWTIVNVVVHGQPSKRELELVAARELAAQRADGRADRVVVHLHDRSDYVGLVASLGYLDEAETPSSNIVERDW